MLAEKIAFEYFQEERKNAENVFRMFYGDQIPPPLEKSLKMQDIAIDALRNRIPQPVKYNNRHGDGSDYWNMDYFNCPACGRRLRNKQHDPYCPRCGQALTWEVKA